MSGLVYPANSLPGGGEANGLSLVEVAPEGSATGSCSSEYLGLISFRLVSGGNREGKFSR